jgi:uncharacterized protein YeaO (DUF488 family)
LKDILLKRVYEPASPQDGFRVLVDRIWPRGMTKDKLEADLWLKDAAPSTSLRKWYHHDISKWDDFKNRYFVELDEQSEAVKSLVEQAGKGPLTLLFASRDIEHNQAVALKEYLLSHSGKK